jgi:glycerophosphoryl diester phosphodiesterase
VDRKIYTAFIVRDIRWIWLTDWIHPDFLHAEYGLINDDIIRFVKERRVRLNAWTVNSRAGIRWLRRIGSDGIITDRPEFCRS